MKILYLSPQVPSVSYGRRLFNFLKCIAGRHSLKLLAFNDPGPQPDAALSLSKMDIHFRLIPRPRWKCWAHCLVGLPTAAPLRTLYNNHHTMHRALLEELDGGGWDFVHIDRERMLPYCKHVIGKVPMLIDLPDALSLYLDRATTHWTHPAKALLNQRERWVMQGYENKLVSSTDCTLVCSEIDRQWLSNHCAVEKIEVIRNVVDTTEFTPHTRNTTGKNQPRCVFTGTMYYLPNIDAMLWYRAEILPMLKQLVPGIKTVVLGYGATRDLNVLQNDPDFEMVGYVPDMAAALDANDVYICPIRIAAGIRNKLLEAMSAGMAVVSTTIGYEGMTVQHGQHLLVGDAPQSFAQSIATLIKNPEQRKQLGAAGREYVELSHSLDYCQKAIESLYQKRCGIKC